MESGTGIWQSPTAKTNWLAISRSIGTCSLDWENRQAEQLMLQAQTAAGTTNACVKSPRQGYFSRMFGK